MKTLKAGENWWNLKKFGGNCWKFGKNYEIVENCEIGQFGEEYKKIGENCWKLVKVC